MQYSKDLSKYSLINFNGEGRINLTGVYDRRTLAKIMIETWSEYIECGRKCSRASYCKYVQKDPYNKERTLEIRCGVASTAIQNFIKHTFYLLENLDDKKIQAYLDGTYYYYKFIYGTEISIGHFLNHYYLDSWGSYAAHAFGQIPYIREDLNQLIHHWKDIKELRVEKNIILVEGESEEIFIKTLDCTSLGWFPEMDIRVYGGKGNISAKKIKALIEEYNNKGYCVFVEGDADKNNRQNLDTLVKKKLIPEENLFVFEIDFESSISGDLLLATLKSLGMDKNVKDPVEFIRVINNKEKSVIPILKEIYLIDLEPIKIQFAQKVAQVINKNIDCWQRESFMQTEIGKFLLFIRKIL